MSISDEKPNLLKISYFCFCVFSSLTFEFLLQIVPYKLSLQPKPFHLFLCPVPVNDSPAVFYKLINGELSHSKPPHIVPAAHNLYNITTCGFIHFIFLQFYPFCLQIKWLHELVKVLFSSRVSKLLQIQARISIRLQLWVLFFSPYHKKNKKKIFSSIIFLLLLWVMVVTFWAEVPVRSLLLKLFCPASQQTHWPPCTTLRSKQLKESSRFKCFPAADELWKHLI